jgi:uncharacterized protein YbjQ (UPF0145 family)
MSSVFDAVFGGSAKDAARAQTDATNRAMEEFRRGTQEAKAEILPRFDQAEQSLQQRSQQSLDVMGGAFTPMLDVLGQGNMNAQSMLAGLAPQQANAILGNSVDYGALQPQGINFDASSFLSGMPDIYSSEQPQSPTQGMGGSQANFDPNNISNMLQGFNGGSLGGMRSNIFNPNIRRQ